MIVQNIYVTIKALSAKTYPPTKGQWQFLEAYEGHPHIIPMNYGVFWLNAPARLIGGDVYLGNIHKGSVNLREGLIEKHFNQSIMVEPKMRIYTVSGTF